MNARLLEELAPDSPMDWTCKHCGETFESEKAFNYHLAFECPENPDKGSKEAVRRFKRTPL